MTQPKRPADEPQAHEPHGELRDRVRERMRHMARLALLAATPLTNAACDPAPTPSMNSDLPTPTCEKPPSSWTQFLRTSAKWETEAGERILLLTVSHPTDKPWLLAPSAYTVEGGTLLPSTAREPEVLRIQPDAKATEILLKGTMTCGALTASMTISIDRLSDTAPTVNIDAK